MKIPELKVVNTYACDAVNQLATVNSDLYVGFNHSKNTLELLVLTKNKCYTVNSEDNDQPICDITVTADESILFTENGKSSIVYQYKVNAEITEFLDISPMRVRAIHANTNGEKYFVGFMDSIGPFLPPSVKSHRGVKILNATGNIIQTIELENDKFSLPNVITTNINGDICVIDSWQQTGMEELLFLNIRASSNGYIKAKVDIKSRNTKLRDGKFENNLRILHCNNKLHTTTPALFEHNVKEIKDIRNKEGENTKTFDLKLVQCLHHIEKSCFAYCKNCNTSLCTDCLVKPNQYDKLSEIVSERMEQLKKVKDKIEEDLLFFIDNMLKLETLKAESQEKYDKIKRQVLIREEEMKDTIANKAVALIKDLDDWWIPQSDQISKMEETLKNAEEDLMHRKAIIEEVFTSEDTTSIFSAVDQVVKDLPIKTVPEIKKPESLRFSTEHSTMNLQVGSLMKIPELRVVDTYKYDATNKLAIVNADLHVGFDESQQTLNLFVFTKTKCYTVKSASIRNKINDITVTPKKSILFTEIGTSSIIYKHEENSGKATFIDIHPKHA
ncbi:unnamed protein product [Mytilus edulis]|uniref:B box-type domain-containing protein n=1 Tax=Mytilus edulis TaxID=6550 RepID=A0A8S3UWG8_MYTED|nr:unnamed protein product [Mytilus edulis]